MGRTLKQLIAAQSPESQERIEAAAAGLRTEIEGLRDLRRLAEQTQDQIADSLGVSQPAVAKIERQSDLYVSTLRRFVEAAGGTLELHVELHGRHLVLERIGDVRVVEEVAFKRAAAGDIIATNGQPAMAEADRAELAILA